MTLIEVRDVFKTSGFDVEHVVQYPDWVTVTLRDSSWDFSDLVKLSLVLGTWDARFEYISEWDPDYDAQIPSSLSITIRGIK